VGTVILDSSVSLDGYMTAANRTPEEPMGPGGLRLMQWVLGGDERNAELLAGWVGRLGASIAGRTTYDTSVPWWGADGPSGAARRPLFVVTHHDPGTSPNPDVYTFVTDGIEQALERAQAAAGAADVVVMGGADLGRQFLAAGLIDEIQIHLAPVLLGAGTRMFDEQELALETIEVIETPAAIHQRFRVLDDAATHAD
jgi:dihydrofolate reductase